MSDEATARVDLWVPGRRQGDAAVIAGEVGGVPTRQPFDEGLVDVIADIAKRLGRSGSGFADVAALAFWLRRSELRRMAEDFRAAQSGSWMRVSRGTVFHIPPANVDTMFVYSWALSVLAGNRNIVRLPSASTPQIDLLVTAINDVLRAHPEIARSNVMVRYDHANDASRIFSAACDLRVIWGGDATIATIRGLPLAPQAREVTFADRASLAAIAVEAYLQSSVEQRDRLAENFANDVLVFDQQGCSSPRVLVWLGEDAAEASADFHARLGGEVARRTYETDAATSIAKLTTAFEEIADGQASDYRAQTGLTVVRTRSFPDATGAFCGGGFLYEWVAPDLAALSPHLTRRHQTLAVFGCAAEELRDFVVRLNGRGIDRIVPIGQALAFNRVWDGVDLLAELTRVVTLP